MKFFHLLFPDGETYNKWYSMPRSGQDAINRDINMTAVCDEIKKYSPDFPDCYLLYPSFDQATAGWRSGVMAELMADGGARDELEDFTVRLSLLDKGRQLAFDAKHPEQKRRYFLAAVLEYCRSVNELYEITGKLRAPAMAALHEKMGEISNSDAFRDAYIRCRELSGRADEMQKMSLVFDYIHGAARVDPPEGGGVCKRIAELGRDLFDIDIHTEFSVVNSNPITALEESLIEVMKLRNPGLFGEIAAFCEQYGDINFFELTDLNQQLRFYLDFIGFMKRYEALGFRFTMPQFTGGDLSVAGVYDLSLAVKHKDAGKVVANDILLKSGELFVLSGPNQGGKTTFLRSLAQNIILSVSGCPAAAERFCLPVYDRLLTHFNRVETPGQGGRLEEEAGRVREILPKLSGRSFVLFNECFAGTRRADGVALSLKLIGRLYDIGCTGGFVTHYYEISEHDGRLISLVAGVGSDGEKDDIRTYKISACPPKGTAYARSIAERCGVTYCQLKEIIAGSGFPETPGAGGKTNENA